MKNRLYVILTAGSLCLPLPSMALSEGLAWEPVTMTVIENGVADWRAFPYEVLFCNGDASVKIDAFYDGADDKHSWRFRFSPPSPGLWKWTARTGSAIIAEGEIRAIAASADEIADNSNLRGQVRVRTTNPGNRRFFEYADGTPFVGLAEQFWDFNNGKWMPEDDVDTYLDHRAQWGFNIVQIRQLSYFHGDKGSTIPYDNGRNEGGHAFQDNPVITAPGTEANRGNGEFEQLNAAYFRSLDERYKRCWAKGFVVAGTPLWVTLTHGVDEREFRDINRYIIARYGAYNIIHAITGEFNRESKWLGLDAYNRVGRAIANYLSYDIPLSIHPGAPDSSKNAFGDQGWLDHDWIQTYKFADMVPYCIYSDYMRLPVRPVFFAEGIREGDQTWSAVEGVSRDDRTTQAYIVRWEAWEAFLSGAAIHTYRHFRVYMDKWRENDRQGAVDGLDSLGARQMRHLVEYMGGLGDRFFLLKPKWMDVSVDGTAVQLPAEGGFHRKKVALPLLNSIVNATGTADGEFLIVYIPRENEGRHITIANRESSAHYTARWLNPRTGEETSLPGEFISVNGILNLPTRPVPENEDWVCILKTMNSK